MVGTCLGSLSITGTVTVLRSEQCPPYFPVRLARGDPYFDETMAWNSGLRVRTVSSLVRLGF